MKKTILVAALAGLIVSGVIVLIIGQLETQPQAVTSQEMPVETVATENLPTVTPEAAPIQPETDPVAAVPSDNAAPVALNYDSASLPTEPLGARTLGDPNAPIKIEEFASLNCSHCADFHQNVFPEFKAKLIDTGKVFFTFSDFPISQSALDASMVARCLPPERYFPFISMLFQSQTTWDTGDHLDKLRQNAKLAGMSDERFDSCVADTALKEGLAAKMREASEKYTVNSTPSFVINGKDVVRGAVPVSAFEQAFTTLNLSSDPSAVPAPAENVAPDLESVPDTTAQEPAPAPMQE